MRLWIVSSGKYRRGHVNAVLVRAETGEEAVGIAVAYAVDNDVYKGEGELPMVDPDVTAVEEEGQTGVLLVDQDDGW